MQYFIIVSGSIRAQNKLQQRVELLANRWSRVLTNSPEEVENDLKAVLTDAAHRFPRCQPLELRMRPSQPFVEGAETYCYWLGLHGSSLVTVTLYRVEALPLPLVKWADHTSDSQQQLTLAIN